MDLPHLKQNPLQKNDKKKEAGQVKIEFYTDPLCCWSWALENPWQQLLKEYSGRIQHRYVMCGMIRDWNSYQDAMNSISKPLQMGPLWMHASEVTQVKMNYHIWHYDPPASSYPPCIAVKTAGLQSGIAENNFLFHIRRSLMEDGVNISKPEVLLSLAELLDGREFDFKQFVIDWESGKGKELFRCDLQKTKFHNIGRYPTLTFQKEDKGIMIVGYRPFEVLKQAFMQMID